MANELLHRYWIEFDLDLDDDHPPGVLTGCGTTAYTREDALAIIKEQIFGGNDLPGISKLIEDVDISTLDAGHVRPNMGNVTHRGIWFPLGYKL